MNLESPPPLIEINNILPFPLKPLSDYAPSLVQKLRDLGIFQPIIIGLDEKSTVTVIPAPGMTNERALFLIETAKKIILNE